MDLLKALDTAYSKASTRQIILWVGHSPSRFAQLTSCALTGTPRIQIRAAWPLSYCVEANPSLAKPHLKPIVRALRRKNLHDAVRRSIVRLLQYVDVPKTLQGEVTDHCFRYLSDPAEAPAIRAFAMRVAEKLVRENRDMNAELRIILEDQLPYAPPAFVSRARKILGLSGNR